MTSAAQLESLRQYHLKFQPVSGFTAHEAMSTYRPGVTSDVTTYGFSGTPYFSAWYPAGQPVASVYTPGTVTAGDFQSAVARSRQEDLQRFQAGGKFTMSEQFKTYLPLLLISGLVILVLFKK